MGRLIGLLALLVVAPLAAGCGGGKGGEADAAPDGGSTDGAGPADSGADALPWPLLGLLQFRVQHNLDDPTCVGRGDCHLDIEEEARAAWWLEQIGGASSLAVLHWDRAIPWLAFADDPPDAAGRVAFHEARFDAALRAWLDAFAAHFVAMPVGYVAVTPLNGMRDGLSPFRSGPGRETDVAAKCPAVGTDLVVDFQYDDGGGPISASFDLRRAYRNFVLYLAQKLEPRYLALVIEADIFRRSCPTQWSGLVELYRAVHDDVRAALGPDPRLFATLGYTLVLDHDVDRCSGGLLLGPCSQPPPPATYPTPTPASCYPLDLGAIGDLDAGDRLDLLALSFYPDGLLQAVTEGDDRLIRVYPEDWDGVAACAMHGELPPYLDPFAALDRIAWTKPVAIAESGSRSCRTLAWFDVTTPAMILDLPGSLSSEAFWLDRFLTAAEARHFEFVNQAFTRDYQPLGLWTVRQGVLTPSVFSIFNTWPCNGIFDRDGGAKPGVTDRWLGALGR